MKKIIGFFFAMLILNVSFLHAQDDSQFEEKTPIGDRFVPHFGFMYQLINVKTEDDNLYAPEPIFYSLEIGTYYMIGHKNDVVSFGVDGNIHAGINFNILNSVNFVVQTPMFLMGRWGVGSTAYNQQRAGLGIGVGGTYTFMNYSDATVEKFKKGFLNPTVLVEGSIFARGGPIMGRIMFSVLPHTRELAPPFVQPYDGKFGFISFGLVYGF